MSIVTTVEVTEIIGKVEVLAEMIVHSELAKEYMDSRRIMQQSKEVQSLIRDFNYRKTAYEDVQRFGRHHPDYLKIRREIYDMKRNLEQHPIIARYKAAEKELEELLFEISKMIASEVSPTILVPNNPYFVGGGCGTKDCGPGGCSH